MTLVVWQCVTSVVLIALGQVAGIPVMLAGSVAFVPQAPFIVNATVRENILFGREFNEQKYAEAVEAANLEPDFAALAGGDLTELGG